MDKTEIDNLAGKVAENAGNIKRKRGRPRTVLAANAPSDAGNTTSAGTGDNSGGSSSGGEQPNTGTLDGNRNGGTNGANPVIVGNTNNRIIVSSDGDTVGTVVSRRVIGDNSGSVDNGSGSGTGGNGSDSGTRGSGTTANRTSAYIPVNSPGGSRIIGENAPDDVAVPGSKKTPTKAGRKPKADTSLSVDVIGFGIQALFSCCALAMGPHWTLPANADVNAVAEPLKKIIDRHTANNPEAFARAEEFAEYAAAGIGFAILAQPAVMTQLQIIKLRKMGYDTNDVTFTDNQTEYTTRTGFDDTSGPSRNGVSGNGDERLANKGFPLYGNGGN